MSQLIPPKEAAELYIEWVIQSKDYGYMNGVSPANIVKIAMLDLDALQSGKYGADYYPSADLGTSLQSAVDEANRTDGLPKIVSWIEHGDEESVVRSKEIEKVLSEEFKQISIPEVPVERWESFTLYEKVSTIAQYRVAKDLVCLSKPIDYNYNYKKYEFTIQLYLLKGGYGGNHFATKLCSGYNVPFYSFLKTLQDESQLCVIPPLDDTQPFTIPKGPSFGSSTKLTASAFGTAEKEKRVKQRCSSVRGYTLEDGPWVYFLVNNASRTRSDYTEISNQKDYVEMLDSLKKAHQRDPEHGEALHIWHSADLAAYTKWRESARQEIQDRNRPWRSAESDERNEEDGEDGEEDEGEPYFQWLMRTLQ